MNEEMQRARELLWKAGIKEPMSEDNYGALHDRDRNAAINILNEGLRLMT